MSLLRKRKPGENPSWQIVDLPERHEQSYFRCLEDWSEEMIEAGDHKARWYAENKDRGLRVKVALDDDDRAIGMIQYAPIQMSPADGTGLYMILCIWVHGYERGVGDHQRRGIGSALLVAAEDDARARGAHGIAAWGLRIPVWMKSAWFKKHGYRRADLAGMQELVWKSFTADANPPRWVKPVPVPEGGPGKVHVVAYNSGWCPASNLVYERARRAAAELGTPVQFTTVDTSDRQTFLACGRTDQVYVDGKPVQRGAPPSFEAVKARIAKSIKKAASAGE